MKNLGSGYVYPELILYKKKSRAMIDAISEVNMAPELSRAPCLMLFQRQTWRLTKSHAMIDAISEVNMAPELSRAP